MIDAVHLILSFVASLFKSRARLEVDLVLRHQLAISRRGVSRRPRHSAIDRMIFVWAYRLRPSVLDAIFHYAAGDRVRWHRAGFGCYWRWKFVRKAAGRRSQTKGGVSFVK